MHYYERCINENAKCVGKIHGKKKGKKRKPRSDPEEKDTILITLYEDQRS